MGAISLDDFVTEATAFLDANAEPRSEQKFVWGEGPDRVGILDEKTEEEEAEELRAAKEWKANEFDAGFGWITGPEEYGGRALDASYQRAYNDAQAGYSTPSVAPFSVGLGMVAPTILAHAIPEVKERYLRDLYRGDLVACQLFSEPAAGSDLAGIQTRAIRDGDEWVVSGQKVWTSGAQASDLGEIITRTSPDKPKHKGLTMFLVEMKAPGVTVRRLRQMTGGASFNEVFFDEVRVHDSHRLGDVDAQERAGRHRRRHRQSRHDVHAVRRVGPLPRLGRRPARPAAARRFVREAPRGALHQSACHGEDPGRAAAGARDVDREAVDDAELPAAGRHAVGDARPAHHRRHRRMGHLRLVGAGARRAWHARRGRHRRSDAQHCRRARPRVAEGAAHRQVSPEQGGGTVARVQPFER